MRRFLCALRNRISWRRYHSSKGAPHLALGRLGEELTVNLMRREGTIIIARNADVNGTEVDVIAREGDLLIFVEVKARSDHSFGKPLEAVDRKRQKRLRAAGETYRRLHQLRATSLRFDIAGVDFSEDFHNPRIDFIRNAF